MSYIINPKKWNKIFAVPAEVVDRHIKLAGSAQLKVLLWMLRNSESEFDLDALSKGTGIARADALDAMQFWVETGIMLKSGEIAPAQKAEKIKCETLTPPTPEPDPIRPSVVELDKSSLCNKPTTVDVARRGQESPELRFLWNQAQEKLGKTLSFNDQRTLLWMHDYLGLPIEVILMIIEYSVSQEKRGISYIEKIGVNWAQDEIFSVELAEIKLSQIKNRNTVWKKLCEEFSLPNATPTPKQAEWVEIWTNKFGFTIDIIRLAFEECLNRTAKINFNYIHKVLENWSTNGFKSPEDIKASTNKPTQSAKSGTSYNLTEFEKSSLKKSIVYKKKKED
ncbi:MAG: DnaD domain protein [Clostridia bacterium]|nr:DnaD domain protein [Clostridia bacterium]